MIAYSHETTHQPEATEKRIAIIGIGSAGTTVLDRLVLDGLKKVELCAIDTDLQNLTSTIAPQKIQLGRDTTRGLGAGGDPEVGYAAAEAQEEELAAALGEAEVVFVLAGLGGGTGSGVAPVITRLAQQSNALLFSVITLPFEFEGRRRCQQAQQAFELIEQFSDAMVCFENDRMGDAILPKAGIAEAFAAADATLSQCVRAMIDLIRKPGLIRIGTDHLLTVLRGTGPRSVFGYGESDSDNRCNEALARALRNPLLDKGKMLADARHVLINITGGPSLTINEVQTVMEEAGRHVHDHTQIFFGACVDPDFGPRLSVTILSSISEPPEPMPEFHPMRRVARAQPTRRVEIHESDESLQPAGNDLFEPQPEPEPAESHEPIVGREESAKETKVKQEVLQFEPVNRGRFEKSEPTIIDGEDLDVPTFMRKKIKL